MRAAGALAPPRLLGLRLGRQLHGLVRGLGQAGSEGLGGEYLELWAQGIRLGFFRGITRLYNESLGRRSVNLLDFQGRW